MRERQVRADIANGPTFTQAVVVPRGLRERVQKVGQPRIAARIAPHGSRVFDLAEQARVTKQSAAFLVDQLATAGYVEKVPDPTDRRARLVRLTARAERVVNAADAELDRILAEWADYVGADRLQQVYETLAGLREITDPWR